MKRGDTVPKIYLIDVETGKIHKQLTYDQSGAIIGMTVHKSRKERVN